MPNDRNYGQIIYLTKVAYSLDQPGQAGATGVRLKQEVLLLYYWECYVREEDTGDPEFDAAFESSDHVRIILDRLHAVASGGSLPDWVRRG